MVLFLRNLHSNPVIFSSILIGIRGGSLVIKFIFSLFIARYLGFDDLGRYGLILALSSMAPSILGLSLMYTLSRKAINQSGEEVTLALDYWARFIVVLYSVLCVMAILLGVYLDKLYLAILIWMVIFFEHANADLYTLLLNISKPMLANILHFIRTALWMLVVMAICFYETSLRSIDFVISGWILGSVVSLFIFFIKTRDWAWAQNVERVSVLKWVWHEFLESKTIYVSTSINSAASYMNHFLITFFLGLDLTGVYVFFMQPLAAMSNLVETGVIQIYRPKLVRAYKERSPSYMKIFRKGLVVTFLLSAVMAVCAWPTMFIIVNYIVDRPLANDWFSAFVFVLMIFIMAMIIQVLRLVFYSQYRDDLILKMGLTLTPVSLILSVSIIHYFGLIGAFLAPVIMQILSIALMVSKIRKHCI